MWKHVPNILTFTRLGLTIVFLWMILHSPHAANRPFFLDVAFVLFVIAGLSDIVDGHVARRFNAATKFGRMIDPLVDKILVCGAFTCFAIIGVPTLFDWGPVTLGIIHWAVLAVLVIREAYVTILRQIAEARGVNFAAVRVGKIKMLLQSFAIGTVMIKTAHVQTAAWGHWFTIVTYLAMITMTVISGLQATRRTRTPQVKAA
ncbi:MAG TPA: CDP-alcohol phosphatidyltransferase family protein [Sedimentisphaerales bacterium]|jgi:CDP-diacylglycerol--glycerol-3-phosphate 3-phosphatidyltransferase|nr:CDP-alcohol phosphatidyltransferase family protein [Sedimentisphaerales bacterium]HNU29771.1 CDP-alcohol phosphatidyltransferase family protein [Sedimentisphaerales bacterium]